MYRFLRNNLMDEYGILPLQDKLLEVMVYIDGFCEEHHIDYCLMAGSALGARRHEGFIPWDDDIDIYMTPSDYFSFREKFEIFGDKDKFYLQEWGATEVAGQRLVTMAKLRMNYTQLQEKAFLNWQIHQGVFVDIFILHHCPNTKSKQLKQYFWSEAVVLKGLSIRGYQKKNALDAALLSVADVLPREKILSKGLYEAYKYSESGTKYLAGFFDTRRFSRAIFPKEIMFPTKYATFEQVRLRVPADNDAYLRIQFGADYMTPPPENARPFNKHAASWELTASDKNTGKQDYCDEIRLI